MKKSLIFASIACAGAFALHAEYGQWFTAIGASATSTNSMNATNGAWVFNVTNGTATVSESHKLQFELDDGETIVFNADQAAAIDTNTVTRVTVKGVFTPVSYSDLPTDTEMNGRGAQVGFVVGSSTVESTTTYSNYVWTGGTDGAHWTAVGDEIAAGDIANETTLLIEFDYSHSVLTSSPYNTVKFSTISSDGTTTNQLGSAFTLTSDAGAAAHSVAGMTCYGSGTLASADGAVQIGVAKVDGVKYGSLAKAATAAAESAGDKTIEVLRETNESFELPADSSITINDPNDNIKGTVTVPDNANVNVDVNIADINSGTSGNYEVPFNMTVKNSNQVTLTLPSTVAEYKEVYDKLVSGSTVTFKLQTLLSIVTNTAPAGKALEADATKLRDFMAANIPDAYTNATPNSATMAAALRAEDSTSHRPLWQSYVLGVAPDASLAAVTAPADTSDDGITLAIPGINPTADYTVSYKVNGAVPTGGASAGNIQIPIDKSGTYNVTIDLD